MISKHQVTATGIRKCFIPYEGGVKKKKKKVYGVNKQS